MNRTVYALRREIVEVGRRVYNRGYVAANDGNISARLDRGRVLITPSGVSKGFMKPEDLIVVDLAGKVLEGRKKPSSELLMHLRIYQERPDVNGVVHAHPPYATGFAVAGIPLTQCVLPEVIVSLGGIPLAEYGTPGTEELFKPVLKYIKDYDAFLLANHGALSIGPSVMAAYFKMETLEHFAQIATVAIQLGGLKTLGEAEVRELIALRQNFGIKTQVSCESCDRSATEACVAAGPAATAASGAPALDRQALVEAVTAAVVRQLSGA